jgi:hypothetical protein
MGLIVFKDYLLIYINVIENGKILICSLANQANELDFLGKPQPQYLLWAIIITVWSRTLEAYTAQCSESAIP